jgi:hypothetical protein
MLALVHLESLEDFNAYEIGNCGEVKARKHSKYGHDFVTLHTTPQNFFCFNCKKSGDVNSRLGYVYFKYSLRT